MKSELPSEEPPLRDAGGSVKGIRGSNTELDKDKLRIVTIDTVCESRKVGDLGVNTDNNKSIYFNVKAWLIWHLAFASFYF